MLVHLKSLTTKYKYHRTDMAKAKCFHCGASAIGDTFEQARKKLDHAVGLSRGIKCGDSYGRVKEILDSQKIIKTPTKTETKIENIPIKEDTREPPSEEPLATSFPFSPGIEKQKKEKSKKSKTKKF